jgi:hypothetical protein
MLRNNLKRSETVKDALSLLIMLIVTVLNRHEKIINAKILSRNDPVMD